MVGVVDSTGWKVVCAFLRRGKRMSAGPLLLQLLQSLALLMLLVSIMRTAVECGLCGEKGRLGTVNSRCRVRSQWITCRGAPSVGLSVDFRYA